MLGQILTTMSNYLCNNKKVSTTFWDLSPHQLQQSVASASNPTDPLLYGISGLETGTATS